MWSWISSIFDVVLTVCLPWGRVWMWAWRSWRPGLCGWTCDRTDTPCPAPPVGTTSTSAGWSGAAHGGPSLAARCHCAWQAGTASGRPENTTKTTRSIIPLEKSWKWMPDISFIYILRNKTKTIGLDNLHSLPFFLALKHRVCNSGWYFPVFVIVYLLEHVPASCL